MVEGLHGKHEALDWFNPQYCKRNKNSIGGKKKKKMKPLFGEVNEFSFQIDSWLMLQTPSEAGLPYVLPKLISQITFCEVFIQTIQIP